MKTLVSLCLSAFLGLAATAASAAPTTIDSLTAERLDRLFADLKVAQGIAEGREIEREIVRIWLESGDPDIDQQMDFAIAAMGLNALDLALNYLNNVIVSRPDFAEAWNKRATVYFLQGRYDDSLADIETTLALEPRHFGALAGRGMIMVRLDDKERALEAFRKAVEIDPHLADIQTQIFLLEDQLKGRGI